MSATANAVDRYAVIGNPVAHSKSPEIHAQFALQTGQEINYQRILAPRDQFAATVQRFIQEGGRGANVTLPFKQEAYALATSLSARAQTAGAVNTLTFIPNAILGDNTDGMGLVADIVNNAQVALSGKRILLLGAGGAARGVMPSLLAQAPAEITIANRTPEKAIALAQLFQNQHTHLNAGDFGTPRGGYDIIINATAASLDAQMPPISPEHFGATTLAYDMMYGAQPTIFMRFATAHGANARDGLGMLVEQAAESFFLWRGVRPDTQSVLVQMRARLSSS